jgi:hypothetical protein
MKRNGERQPTQPCTKCNGTGRLPVSVDLISTLRIVRSHPNCTPAQVQSILDPRKIFSASAFNNRLEYLRELHLVQRERRGRNWSYKAI